MGVSHDALTGKRQKTQKVTKQGTNEHSNTLKAAKTKKEIYILCTFVRVFIIVLLSI